MIVVTYLLRQSITLYKNLGGGLEQNLRGLEPLSPIASAATGPCDASLLPVVSFNITIPQVQFLLLVTSASDLPVHTIRLCSVIFGVTSSLAFIYMIHVHRDCV